MLSCKCSVEIVHKDSESHLNLEGLCVCVASRILLLMLSLQD